MDNTSQTQDNYQMRNVGSLVVYWKLVTHEAPAIQIFFLLRKPLLNSSLSLPGAHVIK